MGSVIFPAKSERLEYSASREVMKASNPVVLIYLQLLFSRIVLQSTKRREKRGEIGCNCQSKSSIPASLGKNNICYTLVLW